MMEYLPGTDYPTKRLLRKQKSLDAGLCALQAEFDDHTPSTFQAVVDEFNTLQLLTDKPMSFGERILTYPSATTFWTAPKNRYPDILPKEETRVLLKNTGIDGSEYINANFVFERQYIATQAPIPTTFSDFWRMVWEQEVCVVVMLTKLTERKQVRAAVYWPQRVGESAQYGSISVQLLHEVPMDSIECRIFAVSDGCGTIRRVAHMHYTGWPDFGVPQSTSEIIDLLRITNYFRARLGWDRPMVTHCSAGIGRAGTFIAIHQAAQVMAQTGHRPRILDLVYAMRQCRSGMVQTGDQYLFIHRAIHTLERMKDTYVLLPKDPSVAPATQSVDVTGTSSDRLAALAAIISGLPDLLPATSVPCVSSTTDEGTRPLISAHSAPALFSTSPPRPAPALADDSTIACATQQIPSTLGCLHSSASSVVSLSPSGSPCHCAPESPQAMLLPSASSQATLPLTISSPSNNSGGRKRQRKGSSSRLNCLMDSTSSSNVVAHATTCSNNTGGMECN